MDIKTFRPLRALMLVQRDTPDESKGGIFIPDMIQTYGWRATVETVGKDAGDYKKGDVILYQKEYTVLPFADRTYAITDAKHVLAKINVVGVIERIMPQNEFVLVMPTEDNDTKSDIFLTDKTKANEPIVCGYVVRCGSKCEDFASCETVWFHQKAGITCVEDDQIHKLVNAKDVLCKKT